MPESHGSHATPLDSGTAPGLPDSDVDRRRFIQESVGDMKVATAWVVTSLLQKYRPWLRYLGSLPDDPSRHEQIMPMSTRVVGHQSEG